jgi:chromosome segregation ATPase
VLENINKQVK